MLLRAEAQFSTFCLTCLPAVLGQRPGARGAPTGARGAREEKLGPAQIGI